MSKQYLFDLPSFSEMEPGEVSIGAPVIDGAIQIGMSRKAKTDKRRLRVVVDCERVQIFREDGEDLQFVTWGLNAHRIPVLGRAASELVLDSCEGDLFGLDGSKVEVNFVRGLDTALGLVSDRAVNRQQENRQAM